jgi:sec-independent protein translocase protein TatB
VRVFNGLSFEKLLLVGVIAVFLLGPDKLPSYAAKLGRLVRTLRDYADGAKVRMKEEMGPEFDEVDWKKLDPRQYDPRRIIREALLDDSPAAVAPVIKPVSRPEPAYLSRQKDAVPSQPIDATATPYDSEST